MASAQGIRAGRAFVELYANDDKLVRGLRSAQRKLKRFGSTVNMLGMQMAKAASVIAIPLALSLKIGANFSDQMSKVKAVTAGTAEEFDILNEKAKILGRTTSFTATQVAEGMVSLGRAGFSRKEIDKAIAGMLDLSRATDTELAEATDIAGATLRQFDLDVSETTRVVDVLAATANGSAQTLVDLGESMKYVAPIASEAGESIESTSASLGILANNGIKGTMAGTALARAYKNLADSKTEKTMSAIGVSVADANGNLRPMADILRDIGKATKGMGNKQRLSIFEDLFGRGQAAAIKLAKNAGKIEEMLDKIKNSSGFAAKAAKEMDNNLGGSFRMFMSAAEGVAIAIKDALDKPLRKVLGVLTEFLQKMAEWIEQNQGLVKTIAVIGGVLAVAAGALIALGATVGVLGFVFGGLATAVTAVSAVLAFLATPMAGLILTITAIVAAVGALIAIFVKHIEAVKSFGKVLLSVFSLFATYMTSGVISYAAELLWTTLKVIWENGVSDLGKTFDALKEAWAGITDAFVAKWMKAIEDIKGAWNGFQDEVNGTKASEGMVEVFDMTQEEAKAWWKGKGDPADNTPITPEFAPEPEGTNDKLDELRNKLANIEAGTPEMDKLKQGESGTFSGLSQLIFNSGKSDEISAGDKFLGSKLDQVKNLIEEEGGLG